MVTCLGPSAGGIPPSQLRTSPPPIPRSPLDRPHFVMPSEVAHPSESRRARYDARVVVERARIRSIDVFPVACTLPRPVGDGQGLQLVRHSMFIRVTTE